MYVVCLNVSLAREQLSVVNSYSAFRRASITGRLPVNRNIPAPRIEALQMGAKKTIGGFSQKSP
jgi:hypothetical protein